MEALDGRQEGTFWQPLSLISCSYLYSAYYLLEMTGHSVFYPSELAKQVVIFFSLWEYVEI